ncbi:hypothetical protein Lal_00004620 [Lupinus albus]|nr:hypothetical protein Lal_00004620 [Lupinus albus]
MKYWLLEHPSIKSFRWSPTQSWGSTWSFLIAAISTYITAAIILHIFLKLCRRHRPVPLGPIPALHSLAVSLISVIIFTGMVFSADAEVRDTRWLWQRTRTTSFEWFLCFPLGIRPSGRVFFWSYVFYLSRFWVEMGLPTYKSFSFTVNCQIVLLVLNLVCHVGVLLLHYLRGGCNGIGAWVFNSVLNVAILLHFLKSYVEMNWLREKPSTHHRHNSSLK